MPSTRTMHRVSRGISCREFLSEFSEQRRTHLRIGTHGFQTFLVLSRAALIFLLSLPEVNRLPPKRIAARARILQEPADEKAVPLAVDPGAARQLDLIAELRVPHRRAYLAVPVITVSRDVSHGPAGVSRCGCQCCDKCCKYRTCGYAIHGHEKSLSRRPRRPPGPLIYFVCE